MPDDFLTQLRNALADRYRIERELGRGGMAVVYLAEDRKLERQVALKVLRPELAASLGAERFLREIAIAAKLSHPNILALHDSGRIAAAEGAGAPDVLFYTMPYVAGESLRDRLRREGALPIADALAIAREVADALDTAHAAGVVHRDIKPENILFQAGHAVVSDFGIARAVLRAGSEGLTEAGIAVGTPAYMSPEQAVATEDIDGRTDVYALGCVLWEMLVGKPPFTGRNPQAVLAQHAVEPVPTLSATQSALPHDLDAVLARALAKQPEERYATAGELGAALRRVELGEATAAGRAMLRRELAALVGVSGLALAAVLYLVFGSGLPYWLLAAAALPLLLQAPFVSTAMRRMRRSSAGTVTGGRMAALRRVALVGAAAVVVVGLGSSATVALGTAGVGPLSTLVSQGALPEHPVIVVADLVSPDDDPELGRMIARDLRDDWMRAESFGVVDQERMDRYFELMRLAPGTPVDRTVAEEIAERAGAEVVLVGSIDRVGAAYQLAVRVVAVPANEQLLADREYADSDDEIIAARDRLSDRLQRAFGESLSDLRRRPALRNVTTESLDALRAYNSAAAAFQEGDIDKAIRRLEHAVTLDSSFGSAQRLLWTYYTWTGEIRRAREARNRACAFRDRLARRERDNLEFQCLLWVDGRPDEAARLAEETVRRTPEGNHIEATNMLMWLGQWERAARVAEQDLQAFERYADSLVAAGEARPSEGGFYGGNLYAALLASRRFDAADSLSATADNQVQRFLMRMRGAFARRDYDLAEALLDSTRAVDGRPRDWRRARVALAQGRIAVAESLLPSVTPWLSSAVRVEVATWLTRDIAAASARLTELIDPPVRDTLSEGRLLWLVRALAHIGAAERARTIIDGYEKRFPADARNAFFAYGMALADLAASEGRTQEAIAGYRAAFAERHHQVMWDEGWDTYFRIGRAFETADMPDSAIIAYQRAIAHPGTLDDYMFFALATERLAELSEVRADTAAALEHYRMLARIWQDADPALQPRVETARERVRALSPGS
jgi:tetratricopeptide (TPR) repeat protein